MTSTDLPEWAQQPDSGVPNNPSWNGTPQPDVASPAPAGPTAPPPQPQPPVPPTATWAGPSAPQRLDDIEVEAQRLGFLLIPTDVTCDPEAVRLVGRNHIAKGVGFDADQHLVAAWPDLPSPAEVEDLVALTGHTIFPAVAGKTTYKALEWQTEQILNDNDYEITLEPMVEMVLQQGASDLHISTGERPWTRIGGTFTPLPRSPRLSADDTLNLARQIVGADFDPDTFNGDLDTSITVGQTRFRVNLYRERGQLGMALRTIPMQIPRFDTLGLPQSALKVTGFRAGLVIVAGATGSGKRLTLTTPVPTPTGMTTMGDLRLGDIVFGRDGSPCQVTGLSPVETHPDLWRVVFSDGQSVVADNEHQWLITDHQPGSAEQRHSNAHAVADRIETLARQWGTGPEFMTAEALFGALKAKNLTGECPNPETVQESLRMMGCPTETDGTSLTYPTRVAFKCLAERLRQRFNDPVTGLFRMSTGEINAASRTGTTFAVPIPGPVQTPTVDLPVDPYLLGAWIGGDTQIAQSPLIADLCATGTMNPDQIPGLYLRASVSQRSRLLQGLIDTAATINDDGTYEMVSDQPQTAATIAHLVRSLGLKATTDTGTGEGPGQHRVRFAANTSITGHLPGTVTGDHQWNPITNITPVLAGDPGYGPARCITVDSPDHTYLCGDGFIATSNSTSLASLLDIINEDRDLHIVTLEAPIEYVHSSKRSLVHQREIGEDTADFKRALKSVLRQDPDIILVGEMRDYEEISLAITAAETGHLVFATVHAHNTAGVIDRVIDVFPAEEQNQVRAQLANTLLAVISQKLLPDVQDSKRRHLAYEMAFMNDAIRSVIQNPDQPNSKITESLVTGRNEGMMPFDGCLAMLVAQDKISREEAARHSIDREVFESFLQGIRNRQ